MTLLNCEFTNGNERSFNLEYCVEIFITDERIELDLLKGSVCQTVVLTPERVNNFYEVYKKVLDIMHP